MKKQTINLRVSILKFHDHYSVWKLPVRGDVHTAALRTQGPVHSRQSVRDTRSLLPEILLFVHSGEQKPE